MARSSCADGQVFGGSMLKVQPPLKHVTQSVFLCRVARSCWPDIDPQDVCPVNTLKVGVGWAAGGGG